MNNHCRCATGGFLAGIVTGALVGAGIALLYAPQSGTETRKKLKRKAGEIKTKALEIKEEALTKIEEVGNTALEKAEDVKKRAKKAAAEFKKE